MSRYCHYCEDRLENEEVCNNPNCPLREEIKTEDPTPLPKEVTPVEIKPPVIKEEVQKGDQLKLF